MIAGLPSKVIREPFTMISSPRGPCPEAGRPARSG
jgi:hypothetical protein